MAGFASIDWASIFTPDASLAESFLRGTLVYLSIIVLFRVVMRRQGGSIGLPDIMLVVLVSECVSAALSAETKSVPNGLAAVSALLFWSYALDHLGHRWPRFQRLLEPDPLPLVRDGKPVRENLDAEGITEAELEAQLRLNGIDDVARVKLATLESGGNVSVIPKEDESAAAGASIPAESPAPSTAERDGPPDFDRVVGQFLAAADELKAAVAWHEGKAADHKAAAKSARDLLTRHGVRATKAAARTDTPTPAGTPRCARSRSNRKGRWSRSPNRSPASTRRWTRSRGSRPRCTRAPTN